MVGGMATATHWVTIDMAKHWRGDPAFIDKKITTNKQLCAMLHQAHAQNAWCTAAYPCSIPPHGGQVILRVILHGHTCPLTATSPFQQASCAFKFSRSKHTSATKHSSSRTLSPGDPRPVFSLPKQLSDHQITSNHFRYI